MSRDWLLRQGRRGVMILVLLLLWALLARFGPWPRYLLPGPIDVAQALLDGFRDGCGIL